MMNKTVEKIKNGQAVETEELFELVNAYNLVTVNKINENKETVMSMQVNQFESYGEVFEFSQTCTVDGNKFVVNQEDIVSSSAEYKEEVDAIFINVEMLGGTRLQMMILHASDSFKETVSEGCREMDVYEMKKYLEEVMKTEDSLTHCMMVRVTDVFGLDFKMQSPERTFVDTLDEDNWKLHISNDLNTFEVPVYDDSCNGFYKKGNASTVEIIVKPYGQPFMEIGLLFFKDKSN